MHFAMTLDRLHRIITIAVLILVPGILFLVDSSLRGDPSVPASAIATTRGVAVLMAAIFGLTFAWAPRGVELRPTRLVVLRRAWPALELPLGDIESVELLAPGGLGLRVFGDGGFFGSYGWFWIRGIGLLRVYTSRVAPLVLIRRRSGRPVALGVDDPEGLRAALDSRRPTGF